MSTVLVDTNVLVSFLTDRNAGQQRQAAELFAAADRGDLALAVPQVVLTELVYVLTNFYKVPAIEVAATLDDLLALPGLATVDEVSWPEVRELWPEEMPALTDAVVTAVARLGRHDAVATFDLKLRRALRRRRLRSYW